MKRPPLSRRLRRPLGAAFDWLRAQLRRAWAALTYPRGERESYRCGDPACRDCRSRDEKPAPPTSVGHPYREPGERPEAPDLAAPAFQACPTCLGLGWLMASGLLCRACHGTGLGGETPLEEAARELAEGRRACECAGCTGGVR